MPQLRPSRWQKAASVSAVQPQTLAVPPPPQVLTPPQLPQASVRVAPQLSVTVGGVVVTNATQTLYQSDFTSGAAGWTVYNGTWSTTGGRSSSRGWCCPAARSSTRRRAPG